MFPVIVFEFDTRIRWRVATCFLIVSNYIRRRGDTHPTPPRPTSADREPGIAHFSWIWSSKVPGSTKSVSRLKGMRAVGFGGVSGRSKWGVAISVDQVRPL